MQHMLKVWMKDQSRFRGPSSNPAFAHSSWKAAVPLSGGEEGPTALPSASGSHDSFGAVTVVLPRSALAVCLQT